MSVPNFNRLFNRHRVTLAEEQTIHNLLRLYRNARNTSERNQRAAALKQLYKDLEKKHTWMINFLSTYNNSTHHSRVNFKRDGNKYSVVFSWAAHGFTEAISPLGGDFSSALDGFHDALLHGDITATVTIRSETQGNVIKFVTPLANLVNKINTLLETNRIESNVNTIASGYLEPNDNDIYTVILKLTVNTFNFQAFLDALHDFGL